jgi:uncharacterized coiled-coil protein SlyX
MTEPSGFRGFVREWLPHAMAVTGIVFAGGQTFRGQSETDRRVEKLEARADRGDDRASELARTLERVDGKIERVDAKLTLLVERTPARP